MELELRCTLESFEGQLSAMAREKVALQKQARELTGQCSTLRKQVRASDSSRAPVVLELKLPVRKFFQALKAPRTIPELNAGLSLSLQAGALLIALAVPLSCVVTPNCKGYNQS